MNDEFFNEKINKQRDYMFFLERLLDVCDLLKEKQASGSRDIRFREEGARHEGYQLRADGWVNQLSACVYHAIASKKKKIDIFSKGKWELTQFETNISFIKDACSDAYSDVVVIDGAFEDNAEENIENAIAALQQNFVDEKITGRFIEESRKFFEKRRVIIEKDPVFCAEKKEIEAYLDSYYSLLVSCVVYNDVLESNGVKYWLLDALLNIDTKPNENANGYYLSFRNPIVLNKIQKTNYGVEAYFDQITVGEAANNKMLQRIVRRTLLTKVQQSFRWYISGKDGQLYHAAIAPYVEHAVKELKLKINAYNVKLYNSYECVSELRLAQKIVYEYGLLRKNDTGEFFVAIFGDLHTGPLKELYQYVDDKLGKQYKEYKTGNLKFHIYTKNEVDFDVKKENIVFCDTPGRALRDREVLNRVMEENNIVFLLDCIELYGSLVPVKNEDVGFLKQKYAFSEYDEFSSGARKDFDICQKNMLEELHETMTSGLCFRKYGNIRKEANEKLISFCRDKQKERKNDLAIYIYVSDLRAFYNLYNDEQYYIRTERYNQKEIGIIRYSSEEITKLKVGGQDQMLVFDLWQFIKNVALEERNIFESKLKQGYETLDTIFIGIDYSNWNRLLKIYYYAENTGDKETAQIFIQDILLPILNSRSRDMFHVFIRKAMCSFFYSAAQNVNDMLFIHLFEDKWNLLGEAVLADEGNTDKVKENVNRLFKYSSKRFYDMIMKNYDISANRYVGQIRTALIIQKNAMTSTNIDKKEIYRNVLKACGNLNYDKSYLAENCREVIKEA